MNVYTGSMNASRLPGQYVYPVVRYRQDPVSAVESIQARSRPEIRPATTPDDHNQLNSPAALARQAFHHTTPEYPDSTYAVSHRLEKGVLLNILG
ncbi:MAG: hypothetical protein KDK39_11010 [Leptospiraceae bacterium]|nr:hypothetical protein [Leptospiraceae bacterium]